MVEAYSYGKTLANDTTLWNATRLALDFWLANDFQSPNWWYNQIGVPSLIAQSYMVLLSKHPNLLNKFEREKGDLIMSRSKFAKWTGL
jgi:hypothetical protein